MTTMAGMQTTTGAPGAQVSESRVDRDSHFNGLFQTKQNLRIEGIAEGEIQCEGMVTVAEGATVKAKVTATTVTIAGELSGEVICRDVFQIMPTGQVEATVSARRLIVQEGGFYNGEFHMITDASTLGSPVANFDRGPAKSAKSGQRAESELLSTDEWWSKLTGESSTSAHESDDKPAEAEDDDNKNKSKSR